MDRSARQAEPPNLVRLGHEQVLKDVIYLTKFVVYRRDSTGIACMERIADTIDNAMRIQDAQSGPQVA